MTATTVLQFDRVRRKKNGTEFYFDFKIEIAPITAILGPSGAGKTTLLNLLSGFEQPDSGSIYLNEEDVTPLAPQRRNFGYLFQNHALFHFLNVRDNILFGPRMKRWDRNEMESRLEAILFQLQIRDLADRQIDTLSGGELQRVALARALAPYPRLLLLDEPLSALDKSLRASLQKTLISTAFVMNTPTLWITHDLVEAFSVANHLILVNNHQIEQYGPKETLYWHPRTLAAAELTGDCNILENSSNYVKTLRPESVRLERQPSYESVKATFLSETREGAVWKSLWKMENEKWIVYRLKPVEDALRHPSTSLYYPPAEVIRIASGEALPISTNAMRPGSEKLA